MSARKHDPMLQVERLAKRFGGIVATDDLSLDVAAGELHAIIGPNGAGKTTLIAQLSGQLKSDAGHIYFAGDDITTEAASHLPMGSGCGPEERIVRIPRALLLKARADIPAV